MILMIELLVYDWIHFVFCAACPRKKIRVGVWDPTGMFIVRMNFKSRLTSFMLLRYVGAQAIVLFFSLSLKNGALCLHTLCVYQAPLCYFSRKPITTCLDQWLWLLTLSATILFLSFHVLRTFLNS